MFLCNDLLVCFDRTAGRKVLRTRLLKMEGERSIMVEFWYKFSKYSLWTTTTSPYEKIGKGALS